MAPDYATQWSDSEDGREQRRQVWAEIDTLFPEGGRILDLGCGIGDDALHFSALGVEVLGIDSSAQMIEVARSRGVNARHMDIQSLGDLLAQEKQFDGMLSNFGALNCVADLRAVAEHLAFALRPDAPLAICVLSRFSWRESFRFVARGDLFRAARRWHGETTWRGMAIHYRSRHEIKRLFSPHFQLLRRISIGGGDHQLYVFRRVG
jgi:SAM-dependent methyltransferase